MRRRYGLLVAAAAVVLLWALVAVALGPFSARLIHEAAAHGLVGGTRGADFYLARLRTTLVAVGVIGTLYIAIAAGLLLAASSPDPRRPVVRRRTLFLFAFLFFAVVSSVPRYLTGDEPHYLLIAQSIATDGDVDVADEYAARPDLAPHLQESPRKRGTHSIHNVGLGLLLALPWALAGALGVRLTLCAVAASLVCVFDAWLGDRAVPPRDRLLATVAFAACLPVVAFAGQVFPDLPAALLVALAARELTSEGPRRGRAWIVALALIALPWLHVRFLPTAVFLTACAWWGRARRPALRDGLVASAALLGTLAVMAFFHQRWFGSPMPNAMRGGLAGEFAGRPLEGLLGLFFDQQYGLLVAAPIYALSAAGLVVVARRYARTAAILGGLVAINLALGALFPMWWGGWSPAGRFLLPVVAVLALLAAVAWCEIGGSRTLRRTAGMLLAISLVIAAVSTVLPDRQYGVPGTYGRSFYVSLAERLLHVDLSAVLPRLVNHAGLAPLAGSVVWLGLWAWLTIAITRRRARPLTP